MLGPLIARCLVVAVYGALHESAFDPKRTFPSDALTTSNLPV